MANRSIKSITAVVEALTTQELVLCVRDVVRWQDEGLLGSGVLFELATKLMAEMGLDKMSSIQQAEAAVLREASMRFIAMQTGLRIDQH